MDKIKLVRTIINMSCDHIYILKLNIKKVTTMATDGMREKRENKTNLRTFNKQKRMFNLNKV